MRPGICLASSFARLGRWSQLGGQACLPFKQAVTDQILGISRPEHTAREGLAHADLIVRHVVAGAERCSAMPELVVQLACRPPEYACQRLQQRSVDRRTRRDRGGPKKPFCWCTQFLVDIRHHGAFHRIADVRHARREGGRLVARWKAPSPINWIGPITSTPRIKGPKQTNLG